jgi:HEAT repeat protein/beta-lactamase regulating signal transducer with metallopeptidase domain
METPVVVDALVKASLVLGATALVAAMLRRASASARHLVWTLGLVGALVAPALSVAMPRWELPLVRIQDSSAVPAGADRGILSTGGSHQVGEKVILPPQGGSHMTGSKPSPESSSLRKTPSHQISWLPATAGSLRTLSWTAILLTLWACGACVILFRMLLGLAAVQWMSRRTPVITGAPWLAEAQALARGFGIPHVRFLRTRMGSMPMAWGILRPSVLMPLDADGWPSDRLRIVVLHELAHVKRRDCLTHLVAQIACAAYWFNPLAWIAVRRLRTERERACDDLVLVSGTRGPDYADQLLEIARVMRAGRFPVVLAGATLAMAHRSQLEGRLMAILDPSVPRRGLTRMRTALTASVFALLLIPVASVQPWAKEAVKRTDAPRTNLAPAVAMAIAAPAPVPAPSPASQPQPQARPERPIEQSAGQAVVDQALTAAVQGLVQSVTQGVTQGVTPGVTQSVTQGVTQGATQGITQGAIQGVVGSIVEHAVPYALESAQDAKEAKSTADPRTVAALTAALKDTDKGVRETALHALVQLRDPSIFEPLMAALKDASADVRQQAAFGLGQMRDRRAVQPLIGAVKDTDADVREQAVFALGQLRDPAGIDALTSALHDTNAGVREQAAFALGQIRDRRAVEPLISALKDEKPDVREQAAFALGQLRDAKAVEALVIALKDANADVREQSAFALGQIRDPRAIDGLTTALKDTNASVRQQAAFALGQIR